MTSPKESLQEYARGLAGGLLFSLPLLYTMEMWQTGFLTSPGRLLLFVAVTFALLLGYNAFAGLRPGTSLREIVTDSVEEMGLGLALSAFVLWILGRLGPGQSVSEIIGKIVVEGMVAAIGVSVGTAQLGTGPGDGENEEPRRVKLGGQLTIALCGAVLVAANVAPTEEVMILGVEGSPVKLLGIAALSLGIAAAVLLHSGYPNAQNLTDEHIVSPAIFAPIVTYAIALASSAFFLWFYGRFDGAAWSAVVSQSVVLAMPGVLGASAGRLLLQAR